MAEPIPYQVKSGDTYSSIAQKLGIKDWHKLKDYHNENAGFNQQVGNMLYANTTLLTPPKDDVEELNSDAPPKNEIKAEQQKEEQKQQNEKQKEEEKKKQEQAAKGDHDGKYFVVHGAKCVCDQAEDPTKTADLQVTTHNIIVLNDQSGKYLATEEDKTFIPPVATFGKCKLKPSSGGYLPCVLAAAPKWNKAYESTQVKGKKSLTEISELLCTMGGKITVNKHGQTDSVTSDHADNTNPLELAMVNPAVEQPKKKIDYPSVSSISINHIENRPNFKAKNSKTDKTDYPVIYLRKGEEAKFEAQLSKGNKQLTSWVVYNDHKGSKENIILVREQVGSDFSQSFEQYGKYRVEAYGKPKSPDFEKGKYDKCDPSCSIDIEVLENILYDLEINDFKTPHFNRTDSHKKIKLRQNFPAEFKAKFHILPSEEEKSHLKIYVLDGAGNVLTDALQTGTDLVFTPRNSNAKYTIVAEYITETGGKIIKQISGETESNTVVSITHSAEVVRPNTSLTFQINKMRYPLLDDDPVSNQEINEIKWNLNGKQIGTGRSVTIPGNMLLTPQKYVIEAYCKMANAFGSKAKHEEDDWHFEVKHNDVVSFSFNGIPKVGKPITATVDKMIFPDLLANETIYWLGFSNAITGKNVTFTPQNPGVLNITSKIKGKGVTKKIQVIQAVINNITFTDSQGNKIEKASWGQDINLWVEHSGLDGEKLTIVLWDDDLGPTDDPVKTIAIDSYNGTLIPVTLDPSMKGKTGDHGEIFIKVSAPELKVIGEGKDFPTSYKLDVEDVREIYSAIIGSADGKEKHTLVDYDEVSYFYAHTRGIKPTENLYLEIRDSVLGKDPLLLQAKNVKVDKSGVIREKIVWNNIKNKVNLLTVYGIVKEKDTNGKVLYDADGNLGMAATKLQKGSSLAKQAGYTGAVKVGSDVIQQPSNENGICECEAKVRAFLRLIMVKESEQMAIKFGYSPYEINVGGKSFIKDHGKDYSTHPRVYISSANSTAAGAYQFLGWKYDEMNGYEIDEDTYKKTGKYTKETDYIKKYGINDFTPLSQDRLCLANIKHHRSGIIPALLKDDLNKALDIASYEWASLPHNDPNYKTGTQWRYAGQHGQTLEVARANYKTFLEEELKGTTKYLQVKKGFLKEFGYDCCGGEPNNTTTKPIKKGYDIDKAVNYIIANAKTNKPYGDCALYVRKAINAGGISGSWGDAWQYISALPKIGFTDLGKTTDFKKGDIVVFNKTGGRKWGHISMWTGNQWVSDFKQNSIIVHNDYTGKDYHIFRWQ